MMTMVMTTTTTTTMLYRPPVVFVVDGAVWWVTIHDETSILVHSLSSLLGTGHHLVIVSVVDDVFLYLLTAWCKYRTAVILFERMHMIHGPVHHTMMTGIRVYNELRYGSVRVVVGISKIMVPDLNHHHHHHQFC
jgi:hypothetical protein